MLGSIQSSSFLFSISLHFPFYLAMCYNFVEIHMIWGVRANTEINRYHLHRKKRYLNTLFIRYESRHLDDAVAVASTSCSAGDNIYNFINSKCLADFEFMDHLQLIMVYRLVSLRLSTIFFLLEYRKLNFDSNFSFSSLSMYFYIVFNKIIATTYDCV